ncbi:hypothetical protein BDAP_000572 [Binucleata daphniae]
MIKIFLYILLSLQYSKKKHVVVGLIPVENKDILIPFEMVIHIAKKVDEILLKNEKAQGSNDEQNEIISNDEQNESSKNDEQNEIISNDEQNEIISNDEQNESSKNDEQNEPTSMDDPSTNEDKLFEMLKKCILATLKYTKEEMEINKDVSGMPKFDIDKIFDAIKNANDMNELKKKTRLLMDKESKDLVIL